jgi:hypothetical protein
MRRRIAIAATLVTVIGVAATVVSITTASASSAADRFTLVSTLTEENTIDQGPAGPSLGDQYIFSGNLRYQGQLISPGRLDGHCIIVSAPETAGVDPRRQCFATITILQGDQEIEAAAVGRIIAEDVLFSVTGGTLRFNDAGGTVLFDYRATGQVVLTFDLTRV